MEQSNFNENPHPCVGVMYPAFLDEMEPMVGRDLPPDGMECDNPEYVGPTIGVFCPAILDEDEADDEYHIETVNVGFRPECVINM